MLTLMATKKQKQTCTKPRKTAPIMTSHHNDEHAFRVWADYRVYQEDESPWKCIAMFRFLRDALDYIAGLQDRGEDCVFQSPADTRVVLATDRRVVYKSE